jgi:plasmid stability protein
MPVINIRDLPDVLHRKLKARAKRAGMSLSDYLLAELKKIAEQPTLDEPKESLRRRGALAALTEMPKPSSVEDRDPIEVPTRERD